MQEKGNVKQVNTLSSEGLVYKLILKKTQFFFRVGTIPYTYERCCNTSYIQHAACEGSTVMCLLFPTVIAATTIVKATSSLALIVAAAARPSPYSLDRSSRILPHILRRRPHGSNRCRQVALMERAHLVWLERADGGMQHSAVMEQYEVLFLPIMWVYQLARISDERISSRREKDTRSVQWRDAASCTAGRAPP